MRSIKLPAAEPPKNGVPPYPKSGEVKSRRRDRRERTVPTESLVFRLRPDRSWVALVRAQTFCDAGISRGRHRFEHLWSEENPDADRVYPEPLAAGTRLAMAGLGF